MLCVAACSKKKSLFKRSQSYNDAAGAQQDSGELDDDPDFLDDFPPVGDGRMGGGVRGAAGQSSLAAKGRKFLKRISRGGTNGEFMFLFLWCSFLSREGGVFSGREL